MIHKKAVEQIFKVLSKVKRSYQSGIPIREAYQKAVAEVAEYYEVSYQTIGDLCRRRQGLTSVEQFINVLEDWLYGNPDKLRRLLIKNSENSLKEQIITFFNNEKKPDSSCTQIENSTVIEKHKGVKKQSPNESAAELTNDPSNIIVAFEMLLEEVETEIDFINSVGSKAFGKRDYGRAKEALGQAAKLSTFRDKTAGLKKEWESFTQIEIDEEDAQAAQTQRQNLGRLQRGMRTSEEAYYIPLLQVLTEMGGSGKVAKVLDRLGEKMKPVLKKCDYEPLSSGPDNPRWRNAAQWARNSMVNEGLLKNDSPRGIWEISNKGTQYLIVKTA